MEPSLEHHTTTTDDLKVNLFFYSEKKTDIHWRRASVLNVVITCCGQVLLEGRFFIIVCQFKAVWGLHSESWMIHCLRLEKPTVVLRLFLNLNVPSDNALRCSSSSLARQVSWSLFPFGNFSRFSFFQKFSHIPNQVCRACLAVVASRLKRTGIWKGTRRCTFNPSWNVRALMSEQSSQLQSFLDQTQCERSGGYRLVVMAAKWALRCNIQSVEISPIGKRMVVGLNNLRKWEWDWIAWKH